ncbi:adenosylcobinamide-GDP ribazoletransferase [Candidatus Auribacterota bacterium]
MTKFLLALQFLTIIPVKIKKEVSDKEIGQSTLFFPLIGLLIGFILGLTSLLVIIFPGIILASLIIIVEIILTGGLHLDGFMDTCDGFYGHRPREKRLEIMKDSRVGAMGVIGVILLLLLKLSLLSHLSPMILGKVLLLMTLYGRFIQVLCCTIFEYAKKDGKGSIFVRYTSFKQLLGATLFTFPCFFIFQLKGIFLFFIPLLVILIFSQICIKKITGMTGDTIGAANEIAEVSLLLVAFILL